MDVYSLHFVLLDFLFRVIVLATHTTSSYIVIQSFIVRFELFQQVFVFLFFVRDVHNEVIVS
jgi:hypothetical protein